MTNKKTVDTPSRRLAKKLWNNRNSIKNTSESTIGDFIDPNEKLLEQFECRPTEDELLQNKRDKWLSELCPFAQDVKKK